MALTPSQNPFAINKAAEVLRAATQLVFGNHPFSGAGFGGMSVGEDFLIFNLYSKIPLLTKMGYNPTTVDQAVGIFTNMSYVDQINFCRLVAADKDGGALIRQIVITDVYSEVLGEAPEPLKFAEYDAQVINNKINMYFSIKWNLRSLIQTDPKVARRVIDNGYKYGMGRVATEAEAAYWMAIKPDYAAIKAAQVPWLYSDSGIKDLVETIDRAFQFVKHRKPTATEANTFLVKAKQYNMSYATMLGQLV